MIPGAPLLTAKVVSALDPQIYTESETFSVGYPSTLIEFSTTGLNFEEIGANDGAVSKRALRDIIIYCVPVED